MHHGLILQSVLNVGGNVFDACRDFLICVSFLFLLGDGKFTPQWNCVDGQINRKSHHGRYEIEKCVPVNVCGRTGIIGRGLLGRYGPNHAGDPIVTRWKRSADGSIHQHNNTMKYVHTSVHFSRLINKLFVILEMFYKCWPFNGEIVANGPFPVAWLTRVRR